LPGATYGSGGPSRSADAFADHLQHRTERKTKRAVGQALLLGKLYDDRGNRMSPSYSTKNGIRYRFYVSSALLRGRKDAAGSVARIAAAEIEGRGP
jgi:hypothetical protein